MLEPGQPFPEGPDALRKQLELLRKQLKAGEMNSSQYAYASARILNKLERLERKKRRVALT
jgi:hypothetical protein